MSVFHLCTLEQSVLGNGKKVCKKASFDEVVAWAQEKAPESVPPFVWQTQLAVALIDSERYPICFALELQALLDAFGYNSTNFTVSETIEARTVFSKLHKSSDRKNSTHSYRVSAPDLGVVWTWDPVNRLTKGLLYGLNTDVICPTMCRMPYILYNLQKYSPLCAHPLLLGLLLLKAETFAFEPRLGSSHDRLVGAQESTGRHTYLDIERNLDAKDVDLVKLSADVCGAAVTISVYIVLLQGLDLSFDFIIEECDLMQERSLAVAKDKALLRKVLATNTVVRTMIRILRRDVSQHIHNARRLQWNSEIVLQTIYTMTTQRDQELAIQIARDSKVLAEQTTKDSNSMKSIAAVTMFFLPGTFVASFFAMPMFSFHIDEGAAVSKSFWIYWAVTLPLTFSVVGIWLVWTNRTEVKQYVKKLRKPKRCDSTSASSPLGSDSLHSSYSTIPAYTR